MGQSGLFGVQRVIVTMGTQNCTAATNRAAIPVMLLKEINTLSTIIVFHSRGILGKSYIKDLFVENVLLKG